MEIRPIREIPVSSANVSKSALWVRYRAQFEVLFVFVLAAVVRLTSLGVFRAVDEEDRWAWAVDFYQALLAGNLPATLVGDGYPGIFPAWLETLWLFSVSVYRSILQGSWIGEAGVDLLVHEWGRSSHLVAQRFPVVLFNTLLVVGIFLYTRKLFGSRMALASAVLISLDPFLLSDSRVNRAEALLTGLMMISLLALLASLRESKRNHFVISAVFGGFACLTKLQALVLLPIFGVIGLIWLLREEPNWQMALWRWLRLMFGWTSLAAFTFALLWPAVWTTPVATFELMTRFLTRKVGEEGVKMFFLGRTVLDQDPGPLFYPVIFILRITPLVLIGLLLGIWQVISWWRQQGRFDWRRWLDNRGLWVLTAFVLLYAAGMSLGGHKQDRFLMIIFPALDLLAAAAFVIWIEKRQWAQTQLLAASGIFLGLQLLTALPFHPYYFSYFNPLVGGGPAASRLTRIGWGEGMDQVADYLNTLENPNDVRVASRFSKYFVDFRGNIIDLDAEGDWARADKIVFYIQQTQRMIDPSPGVIRYFQQHVEPEKVITIDGIDYAWIYPNPIAYPADPTVDQVEGQLKLFGYRWSTAADGSTVDLIWKNLGWHDANLAVRLWANAENDSDWLTCAVLPGFEASAQTAEEVVESRCSIPTMSLPPGLYSLQIGLNKGDGVWQPLDFAAGWSAVEVKADGTTARVASEVAFAKLADEAVPPTATRLERAFDFKVQLLAYELDPARIQPGQTLPVTLYWQATRPLEENVEVTIQAFLGDERLVLLNGSPVDGTRPTRSWQPGEVIRDEWAIDLPAELPTPALVRLDVGLFRPDTLVPLQVRNLAGVDIPGAITYLRLEPAQWPVYEGQQPDVITFGDAIQLIGHDLSQSDNQLHLTLYWQTLTALDQDYTAFVQLLRPDGTLAAQSDVQPGGGYFPTSAWQPGDVVLSQHPLNLPADLPAGDYTLVTGLYHPGDFVRLPAVDAQNTPIADNAAMIERLTLP